MATTKTESTKAPMPLCPSCKSGDDVVLVTPDDGRGVQFRCKGDDCGETFRAKGPYARGAVAATLPAPPAKPSTPPPATSRTGAPRSSSSSSRDDG